MTSPSDDEPADAIDTVEDFDDPAPASASPDLSSQEEVDVWWGGYASRAMLPSLLACLLITALLIGAAIFVVEERHILAVDARAVVYVLAGLLWALQTGRWLYRVGGTTYRLTNRRLYCHWGIWHPKTPPTELGQVDEVVVEQSFVENLLRVGRIRLELENGPALVLAGVPDPAHVADDIGRCVKACHAPPPEAPEKESSD